MLEWAGIDLDRRRDRQAQIRRGAVTKIECAENPAESAFSVREQIDLLLERRVAESLCRARNTCIGEVVIPLVSVFRILITTQRADCYALRNVPVDLIGDAPKPVFPPKPRGDLNLSCEPPIVNPSKIN